MRWKRVGGVVGPVGLLLGVGLSAAAAQNPPVQPPVVTITEPAPAGRPGGVVLRSEPIRLTDADAFQVDFPLEPIRRLEIAPRRSGIVEAVRVNAGDRIADRSEILRLDPTAAELGIAQARARLEAVEAEVRIAKAGGSKAGGNADEIERAEAALDAAKADLDLATLHFRQNIVRAPFGGQIFRVAVVPGQSVRRGDVVAVVGDTARLQVEIPVDRRTVKVGDSLPLRLGDRTINGRVSRLLPLAERFARLRELIDAAASAIVVVDNARGELGVGQLIHVPWIPEQPVAAVPTGAVGQLGAGRPKVQVLRGSVVRDVPVTTHGRLGADRVYVSGPFTPHDRIIVSLSNPLPDGTMVGALPARPK